MGGGVVGIELGLVYASYGVEVTVVEMADRIIPAMDKEVSLELQKILAKKGMKPDDIKTINFNDYKKQQYDILANSIRENIDMKKFMRFGSRCVRWSMG